MDNLACLLSPVRKGKSIYLPDGIKTLIGRGCLPYVKSVYYSRKHIKLIPNYTKRLVVVTSKGKTASFVDGEKLAYGRTAIASEGSKIELIRGGCAFKIIFRMDYKMSDVCSTTSDIPENTRKSGVSWEQPISDVIIGTHPNHNSFKTKVAAFDLDNTLIKTKSGRVFPLNSEDWKAWDDSVKPLLSELFDKGYQIVIFTNQASLSKPNGKELTAEFKQKVEAIIDFFSVPLTVYISTSDGYYRKPAPGMWDLFRKRINYININMSESFFVGDAAGRNAHWMPGKKADFSDSDRLFAINIGLRFQTPEEIFFHDSPKPYGDIKFSPSSYKDGALTYPGFNFPNGANEVILMVGSPASGKSHFVRTQLSPKQYQVVSRDQLGTWQKCVVFLKKLLLEKKNVVVDNTNPDIASRQRFIDVCKEMNVPTRCFIMTTSLERCLHNNKFRKIVDSQHEVVATHLIKKFFKNIEYPSVDEGFSSIIQVPFVPFFSNDKMESIYNLHLVAL